MSARWALTSAVAAACIGAQPASAERVVSSLSTHQVLITSNYTGTQLVLFGSVERDDGTTPRQGGYDIIAIVTGPRETLVARRKERVLGIWANVNSRMFVGVPAYLAVLANRPIDMIAEADTLRRQQIGLQNVLLPQRIGTDTADVVHNDPFRVAFLRIQTEHGLYRQQANAVTFFTPNLFRAEIALPSNVPVGTYDIDLKLFVGGVMIARTHSAFDVMKAGFEQFVANAAQEYGLLYGIVTSLMALFTGWFASVVFRRD